MVVFISKPLFSKALDLGFWDHPATAEFYGADFPPFDLFVQRGPANTQSVAGGFN